MFKRSLLTLALLAMVGMVSAQTIQFEYDGTVYEDGQTVICPFDEVWGEYLLEMHIKNLTDTDKNIIVEKQLISEMAGVSVYFCWGSCFGDEVTVSRPVNVPAGALSTEELSFHFQFSEGITGIAEANYYAYDIDDPENRISLHLRAGHGANVTENTISTGHAYPNPATTQVHFDLKGNGGSDMQVVVYNLLGQEIKSQLVSGNQSRVNIAVDDLQPGIYFCRFQVNNVVMNTEKFIVKR